MTTILHGDCRAILPTLSGQSVQTCVTSPPYFGLRDYGTGRWEGGDAECAHAPTATPVRRGVGLSTLAGGKKTTGHQQEGYKAICVRCGALRSDSQIGLELTPAAYVAVLVGVFREVWRVLRDDGTLWLNLGDSYAGSWGAQSREHAGLHASNVSAISANQVIAAQRKAAHTGSIPPGSGLKPKDLMGMPWRVAFALQEDGWYLRSDIVWAKPNPMPESVTDRPTKSHEYLFLLAKQERYYYDADAIREPLRPKTYTTFGTMHRAQGNDALGLVQSDNWGRTVQKRQPRLTDAGVPAGANRRTVWTIAAQPYAGAHFAVMPEALVEPCILAGSRPGDTVLDPFAGSGTVLRVAEHLQRESIGIDLNPDYIKLQERRTDGVQIAMADLLRGEYE